MPSNYTSPFASSFKSAVNRGTSWTVAVQNIAKRNNKTVNFVWNPLWKAGICSRQKFNGQWIYWPNNCKKSNATNWKNSQFNSWQWFCEWAIMNGFCTPEQLNKNKGSQKEFMNYCRKFFAKQFVTNNTTKKSGRKTTTRKSTKRTTSKSRSYKFPTTRRTTTRRRAA
jgi:hypothetical protein